MICWGVDEVMFNMLFSPITIGKTEIKNRIVFPSIGVLYSVDEKLNDRYVDYYVERARGGAGIVTVGPVGIGELGVGLAAPSIATDDAIPSFAKLARAIQKAGAKAWMQLYHGEPMSGLCKSEDCRRWPPRRFILRGAALWPGK
jgi:2,4-dienoyl-CoA reductase (NADPH2)